MIDGFHFIRPAWLWALIPLLFLLLYLQKKKHQHNAWHAVCDSHLLPHLLLENKYKLRLTPLVLLTLAWALTTFALAGPTWSRISQPVFRSLDAQVIAVELSPSLYATDLTPNRLTRAKFKIKDILKNNHEGQIGMVAFTSEAYVVSPLTQDAETISAMVPELKPEIMPVQGNNISEGLRKAADLLKQAGISRGHIILMTDQPVKPMDFVLATQLNQQGITTSILGLGTKRGAPILTTQGYLKNKRGNIVVARLPYKKLQQLAARGGGRYMTFTNDNSDIQAVTQHQKYNAKIKTQKTQQITNRWRDQGHWFVLFLLPLAAFAFRRGWFETIVRR